MSDPLHVWTYWQGPRPAYIDVCLKSMADVCNISGVEFHLVTPGNLHNFIGVGDLHPNYKKLRLPNMASNCVRVALLAKYGGWWWDADTVGLKSPLEVNRANPDAEMLYMTWTKPPRRILNGYIYARPESLIVRKWLEQINYKVEHDFEKANTWLELGEKLLTPLLNDRPGCVEIERRLFLPVDIDAHVPRFFKVINFKKYLSEDTVCYGLNHSWFNHNRHGKINMPPHRWKNSPLLIHQLLQFARENSEVPANRVVHCPKKSPANKTAVVTLATGDYWKGAQVLFHSLERHGMPDEIDRIVISNDRVDPTFAKRVPITHSYDSIQTKSGQFAETANKFFALTLDYDRIILVDSDIFCVQDCKFLWSNHLNSLPFYAVRDSATYKYYPKKIDYLQLDKNLLFNGGTMVYNRNLMPDLHERILDGIRTGRCQTYDGGDQGYFNAFFQVIGQEVGYLPNGYNYLLDPHMPQLPEYARYLFHFAGGGLKPWSPGFTRKPSSFGPYIQLWQQERTDES